MAVIQAASAVAWLVGCWHLAVAGGDSARAARHVADPPARPEGEKSAQAVGLWFAGCAPATDWLARWPLWGPLAPSPLLRCWLYCPVARCRFVVLRAPAADSLTGSPLFRRAQPRNLSGMK